MSGNTTHTGLSAGQGQLVSAAHHLLPIPLFVIGVFVGTFLIQGGLSRPVRSLCGLVSVLLISGGAASNLGPAAWWCAIIPLSTAMGLMNTTITHVGGQSVSLVFVTGDLNNFARHLAFAARRMPAPDAQATWDTHWWRAALFARVWCMFLLGALLAGAWMRFAGAWTLLPPILSLLLMAVCARTDFTGATPPIPVSVPKEGDRS